MGSSFTTLSPRQRMINLMYLVFIALLALNVSPDMLQGDDWLENSLNRTVEEMKIFNELLRERVWNKTTNRKEQVESLSYKVDSLIHSIDYLKEEIIQLAGTDKTGNYKNEYEAVAHCMLAPVRGEAKKLRKGIEEYREYLINLSIENLYKELFENILNTTPVRKKGLTRQEWEISLFENKPVGMALQVLSKLQQDILWSEEVFLTHYLLSLGDNDMYDEKLAAYVLSEKELLRAGDDYEGEIIVGLLDSSFVRRIRIDNKEYNGQSNFQIKSPSKGTHQVSGEVEVYSEIRGSRWLPFKTSYTVVRPFINISSSQMNALYAGYRNELTIATSGIPAEIVRVDINNGSIRRDEDTNTWYAIPDVIGKNTELSVLYSWNKQQYTETFIYRVIPLPEPSVFISYVSSDGNTIFKGGSINRHILLKSEVLEIGYEDNLLEADFEILSFELSWNDSFGNLVLERVDGNRISVRQKEIIKNFPKGKKFYFSGIRVQGKDKVIRDLPLLEVILN